MVFRVLKYTGLFVLLVLFQGLILNNVEFGGYVVPFLYVIFILALPFETPSWLVLILGFILGISIDAFSSTMGMHTAATVVMAFCRAYLLKLVAPRGGYEFNAKPSVQDMGVTWYLLYAFILVLFHHLFLFYLESFKITQFFYTFGRAISSTIFTLVLILVVQLFNYKSTTKS
ncbi:rod shape-determining protein MreD [Vicingaceae bacterium]|jgi:rod shape-determining protein MreD|nr:rod shape-determining protein MreD [Vicingaceae bacterium]